MRRKIEAAKNKLFDIIDSTAKVTNNLWVTDKLLTFKEFCAHKDHMNFPTLSENQLSVADFLFGDDPKKAFDNENFLAVVLAGKGSGKDTLSVLIMCYIIYLLENMSSPQAFFGMPEGEPITLINVALNPEQAVSIFFEKFKQRLLRWEWLKRQYNFRYSGQTISQTLSRESSTRLDEVIITSSGTIFPKLIRAIAASPEESYAEGKNVLFFVIDEAGAFPLEKAEHIYKTLRDSAESRFLLRYKSLIISWPRHKNDFSMLMYKRFLSDPKVYTCRFPLWEFKPEHFFSKERFTFSLQVEDEFNEGRKIIKTFEIPIEFKRAFEIDPTTSAAKYLCYPPDSETPFFEITHPIERYVDHNIRPLFVDESYEVEINKQFYVRKSIVASNLVGIEDKDFIICVDLSVSHCATALAVMHQESSVIYVDYITRWLPDPQRKVYVDLLDVKRVIFKLAEILNVSGIYFDRFQSSSILMELRQKGYEAQIVSLYHKDYEIFKHMLYQGYVKLINNEELIKELSSLQLVEGKEVITYGYKDMADVVVTGVKVFLERAKRQEKRIPKLEGELIKKNFHLMDGEFIENSPSFGITTTENYTIDEIFKKWQEYNK